MSWNKISIEQGQAIIVANNLEPLDRDIKILSVLHKKPVEYFEAYPKELLMKEIEKTSWVDQLPDGKNMKIFRSGNYVYKFRTLPEQLSKSDFAMLQKLGQGTYENLHKILALLSTKYRMFPQKQIIGTDFEARSELFLKKMPFGTAYAYCLFFSTYYPHLLNVGLSFSQGVREAAQEHLKTQSLHG